MQVIDEALPSVRRFLTAHCTSDPFELYRSIDARLRVWRDEMLDQAAVPAAAAIANDDIGTLPLSKARRPRTPTFLETHTSAQLSSTTSVPFKGGELGAAESKPIATERIVGDDEQVGGNSDESDHDRVPAPVERRGHAEWRTVAKEDPFLIPRDPLPIAPATRGNRMLSTSKPVPRY